MFTLQTGAERSRSSGGLRGVDELSGVEGGADRAVPRGSNPRPPDRAVGGPERAGDGAAAARGGHPCVGAHAPESGQRLLRKYDEIFLFSPVLFNVCPIVSVHQQIDSSTLQEVIHTWSFKKTFSPLSSGRQAWFDVAFLFLLV